MLGKLSNSMIASSKIAFKSMSEPCCTRAGVFVGHTQIYRTPFFLDCDSLVNRHMAVIGMTGSGKTYFLKSHITRCVSLLDASLLVIDWNGEYDQMVLFLGGRIIYPDDVEKIEMIVGLEGIMSLNLSMIKDDSAKRGMAESIMRLILVLFSKLQMNQDKMHIILLDEAWKMISDRTALTQLFREGRKYGVSVCIATQLVNDIDNSVIGNCACLAIFKLQSQADYSTLLNSGIITNDIVQSIAALDVGACMIHLALKNGHRASNFFIKRVCGISNKKLLINGDKMRFEVTEANLSKALETFVRDLSARARIMDYISANNWKIGSVEFVRMLAGLGLQRSDIVPLLRKLGLDDISVVLAYEEAKGAILVPASDQLSSIPVVKE